MDATATTRRGLIGTLLLHRIDVTDAKPWLGAVGLVVTLAVGCCLDGWLL